MTKLAIFGTVSMLCACSGDGDGGGGGALSKQNVDPDSVYGFDGAGWSQTQNEDGQDIWTGPDGLVLVIGIYSNLAYETTQAWAEDDYGVTELTGATMNFAPESLGNGVWWWGWYYGGDNFEGYVMADGHGVQPELQTEALPKDQAAKIIRSFALVK